MKLDTAQQGESICDSWSSSKRRRGLNKCATDGDKMSRVVHRKSVKRRWARIGGGGAEPKCPSGKRLVPKVANSRPGVLDQGKVRFLDESN